MNAEEAIAVLRRATDSALFRGDEELATALVCGINALKAQEVLRRVDHTLSVHGKVDAGTPLHEAVQQSIQSST